MKAIKINLERGQEALIWDEYPEEKLKPGEVTIDIHYAGVNRADLLQRKGRYDPPPGVSPIIGLEVSGIVSAISADVINITVGQRVCALLSGGGYAEKVNVKAELVHVLDDSWSLAEGAAFPEGFYAAYVNLFSEGNLKNDETVLIHAGGSGVGSCAIQLAKHSGAKVFTTVGTKEKADKCTELGADFVINYKESDFLPVVLNETNGVGVDLILDCVGGSYLENNISLLKKNGRLVVIGLLGGGFGDLDLSTVLQKRLKIIGSVLRSRTLQEKVSIKEGIEKQFGYLIKAGKIKPVIDSVFEIKDIEKAHARMKRNENFGKILLEIRK